MKLFHSNKTYEELLQGMQKDGYSQNYMKCVNREIRSSGSGRTHS